MAADSSNRWLMVAGGVVVAGAMVCVAGLLLPGDWQVQRSTVIDAEPATVFELVNSYDGWVAWGAWATEIDPDLEFLPGEGPPAGEGMTLQWYSGGEPQGVLVITESQPPDRVAYDMTHGVPGQGLLVRGTMDLDATDGSTRVTWTEEGEIPLYPHYRYIAFFTSDMIGEDLEKGLASLKAQAELRQAQRAEDEADASMGGGPSYEGN